jgi:enoyl-CoA hydratase/carnithine racemase
MSAVLLETLDHITTLTLNEPATKNAISEEMIDDMINHCATINNDHTTRVVILKSNGNVFSSGGNVKEMIKENSMFSGSPDEITKKYEAGIQRLPQALLSLQVPLIASIQGAAIGAGMDMCLCADIRIASHAAFFAHSFVKLGLISGDGGHWLLNRAVGYSKALELSLTGARIVAEKAYALGMINQLSDDLEQETQALAQSIASNPRPCLIGAKRLTQQAAYTPFKEAQRAAAQIQGVLHNTEEHKQRVLKLTNA